MTIAINLLLVFFLIGVSPTLAAIVVGDQFRITDPNWGDQGPFILREQWSADGEPLMPAFESFCVETKEYIIPGNVYTIQSLNPQSVRSGRYLTPYVAWIYTRYIYDTAWRSTINTYKKYNYVQQAIWAGMVYALGDTPGSVNSELGSKLGHAVNLGLGSSWDRLGIGLNDYAQSGWSGFGNVMVANLWGYTRYYDTNKYKWLYRNGPAQDQLVLIPEPLNLIIWSLLSVCIGSTYWLRRHKLVACTNRPR